MLANILELLRITENRYSGIPTIYRAFEDADLPKPEFIDERGVFKVRLRNGLEMPETEIEKTDIHRAVVQFCRTPRSREEITAFTGKSRFVLLHAFKKESQKTPDTELRKAEREYKDWIERKGKI